MRKERFDPSHLIGLAQQQRPSDDRLIAALAQCTLGYRTSRAYLQFEDPDADTWAVAETVMLEDRKRGDVLVDVLTSGKVGGIEFLKRL